MQHRYYPLTGTREPEGVAILCIHGFVEELVVNDDPEYQVKLHTNVYTNVHCIMHYFHKIFWQWIDRLRTPRSSNEARQRLFLKLSGCVCIIYAHIVS